MGLGDREGLRGQFHLQGLEGQCHLCRLVALGDLDRPVTLSHLADLEGLQGQDPPVGLCHQ